MKRIIRYISEILFAFILIFVSYFAWDRIDVEAYEKYISQYTLEDVQIVLENNFNTLSYLSDENLVEDTVLYVNNFQDKVYNTDIFLVLSGLDERMINDLYLSVDGKCYSLNDIYKSKVNNEYYFLISNINLKEYEKTNYNLKLLVDDSCDFDNFTSFSYNIKKEIKG